LINFKIECNTIILEITTFLLHLMTKFISFNYSLNSLIKNKEKYFIINFNEKKIKILVNNESKLWVKNYKSNWLNKSEKERNRLNLNISSESFFVIFYFFKFILPDVLEMYEFLNVKKKMGLKILNIGAGLGFFEVFISQLFDDYNFKFYLIEQTTQKPSENGNNSIITLHPLKYLNSYLKKNNLRNFYSFSPDEKNKFANINFDIVFSFRSWGFLYDLSEYSSFIKNNLDKEGFVITDLIKESIEKFRCMFLMSDEISNKAGNNFRFIGKHIITK